MPNPVPHQSWSDWMFSDMSFGHPVPEPLCPWQSPVTQHNFLNTPSCTCSSWSPVNEAAPQLHFNLRSAVQSLRIEIFCFWTGTPAEKETCVCFTRKRLFHNYLLRCFYSLLPKESFDSPVDWTLLDRPSPNRGICVSLLLTHPVLASADSKKWYCKENNKKSRWTLVIQQNFTQTSSMLISPEAPLLVANLSPTRFGPFLLPVASKAIITSSTSAGSLV